jgi:hypothetical protein
MKQTYNVYCDESCHLENDDSNVMVLGAIWCPRDKAREIAEGIREIKRRFKLPPYFEVKWTKVSPAKLDFYLSLIDYFFQKEDLNFRAVVIPDKSKLCHEFYNQDHDLWYYKMYYVMLKEILDPLAIYCIYLDIKDTRSADKVHGLENVLRNLYFQSTIEHIQNVRSEEIEQIQLADLILGGISYANRKLKSSEAKLSLVKIIEQHRKKSLILNSKRWAKKFNLFVWEASWRDKNER